MQLHRMTLLDVLDKIAWGYCVCLLLLVWILNSEGHTIRRTPPGCYRSLRHCKAKCCGSGKFCDSVVIRGCTWYKCVSAECDVLHDPTNGKVSTSMGTNFESLATYTCNDGYVLSHTGKIVCLSSGQWSDAAPTCLSVGCDPLDPPCAGSISAPNTTVGSIATYSCDLGFYLTGDVTRTCQSDGYWSGSMPCCEKWCSGFLRGGNLVKIDDELEQNFLDMVEAGDGNDWWIGLERVNGNWIWISDNSSLGFQQWATGYPTGSDNCVVTNSGSWRNIPCTYKRSFICSAECFVDV